MVVAPNDHCLFPGHEVKSQGHAARTFIKYREPSSYFLMKVCEKVTKHVAGGLS